MSEWAKQKAALEFQQRIVFEKLKKITTHPYFKNYSYIYNDLPRLEQMYHDNLKEVDLNTLIGYLSEHRRFYRFVRRDNSIYAELTPQTQQWFQNLIVLSKLYHQSNHEQDQLENLFLVVDKSSQSEQTPSHEGQSQALRDFVHFENILRLAKRLEGRRLHTLPHVVPEYLKIADIPIEYQSQNENLIFIGYNFLNSGEAIRPLSEEDHQAIQYAFQQYERYTPFRFYQTDHNPLLVFQKDDYQDSRILAETEIWSLPTPNNPVHIKINPNLRLLKKAAILIHELGHFFGLKHSKETGALCRSDTQGKNNMSRNPVQSFAPMLTLSDHTLLVLETLYGARDPYIFPVVHFKFMPNSQLGLPKTSCEWGNLKQTITIEGPFLGTIHNPKTLDNEETILDFSHVLPYQDQNTPKGVIMNYGPGGVCTVPLQIDCLETDHNIHISSQTDVHEVYLSHGNDRFIQKQELVKTIFTLDLKPFTLEFTPKVHLLGGNDHIIGDKLHIIHKNWQGIKYLQIKECVLELPQDNIGDLEFTYEREAHAILIRSKNAKPRKNSPYLICELSPQHVLNQAPFSIIDKTGNTFFTKDLSFNFISMPKDKYEQLIIKQPVKPLFESVYPDIPVQITDVYRDKMMVSKSEDYSHYLIQPGIHLVDYIPFHKVEIYLKDELSSWQTVTENGFYERIMVNPTANQTIIFREFRSTLDTLAINLVNALQEDSLLEHTNLARFIPIIRTPKATHTLLDVPCAKERIILETHQSKNYAYFKDQRIGFSQKENFYSLDPIFLQAPEGYSITLNKTFFSTEHDPINFEDMITVKGLTKEELLQSELKFFDFKGGAKLTKKGKPDKEVKMLKSRHTISWAKMIAEKFVYHPGEECIVHPVTLGFKAPKAKDWLYIHANLPTINFTTQ